MPGPLTRCLRRHPGFKALALLVAFVPAQAGTVETRTAPPEPVSAFWRPGRVVPIAVSDGCARFQVPTSEAAARTLVIVSTLAREDGPFRVRLKASPTTHASLPPLATEAPRKTPSPPTLPLPPILALPSKTPPRQRTFHLMVRDGDVASASNYLPVAADLRAVGHRVQVYVDHRDSALVRPELLRDLVTTFDDRVFPTMAQSLGQARDVDGDGRFTVLISGWLTRLAGGRHAVDGFVRGADLDPSVSAPFGNRCDMMYLSTALGPGPYLRTVLAHEYAHAVTVTAKSLAGPDGTRTSLDEEGWLDEAIAHLAEDLHGFSRSNLDYRVSAFLSCPERYRLVVEDYYAAGLFRSHGNRGGTYLFLRWCADRFGPGLLPALVRSDRRGIANLEAATGAPFANLYRQWSAALYLSGLCPNSNDGPAYRSLEVRGPFDDWELAGPRTIEVAPGGPDEAWTSAATSSHFVVVSGSTTGAVAIEVAGPAEAELQVSAIALPPTMARLELAARLVPGTGDSPRFQAEVRERRGQPVRLSALAWEPLVPPADPHVAEFRRGALDMLGIAARFGTSALPAHGRLESQPIALAGLRHGSSPLLIKVVGTDAAGHRVAAWAVLNLPALEAAP